MKGILCVSRLILLIPSVAYAAALPGDSADGKRLHDANCMGCHDAGIYTRQDRLVGSLHALKNRLGDCSHMAKKEFSAIETQNIIKYLNDQFYHFR
jgi:mono/diheme cytochrome c family protein